MRRFLGSRGRVNKAMQKTLLGAPERFGLYNNGITIVVEDFNSDGDGRIELIEPYVVNGCQTTRTIWDVFQRRLEAGGTGMNVEMEEWRRKAEQGVVITKVVKVGAQGDELLQDITRYTNSQNAVREKDFLGLSSDFKTWSKQMQDRYGVFLEVQRGGWDSRRALQKQRPDITQFTEAANAFDLLKVYGAGWLKEAGTAFGRNASFLPNGTIFKRIINSEAAGGVLFGVEDLYATYLVEKATDAYGFGRGAAKTSRRQTRFLFYLIALELLKNVLILAGMSTSPKDLTQAVILLFEPANKEARKQLLDTAVGVVDEYLTPGTDDSVFTEPPFVNAFNSDLNGYLKWEQLGKSEQASPHLHGSLAVTKRMMGKGGDDSIRALVTSAVQKENEREDA